MYKKVQGCCSKALCLAHSCSYWRTTFCFCVSVGTLVWLYCCQGGTDASSYIGDALVQVISRSICAVSQCQANVNQAS